MSGWKMKRRGALAGIFTLPYVYASPGHDGQAMRVSMGITDGTDCSALLWVVRADAGFTAAVVLP